MHEVRSIHDLLNQIGRGEILLPEFQRGYVWNRNQVRGLMQSLYRRHPTGHLLIWRTHKPSLVRGGEAARDGHSLLLLDGQQRLTSLYVLFEGKAPPFYEGEDLFFNLYFNLQTEEFRFWQKTRMANNPAWIGVHKFLSQGLNDVLERLRDFDEEEQVVIQQNLARLSRLDKVRDYTYTVDQVSGDDYDVDEVVDIFNRVNSKGTPLKRTDLALAHVCSIWPEARAELRGFKARMSERGFDIDLGILVRCLAGIATGSVLLEGPFFRTPETTLKSAWERMQPAFEHLLDVLSGEARVVSLADLATHFVLVPPTVYLACQGGEFPSDAVRRRFIRWFFLAGLWARYSGSTPTKLQQDVALAAGGDPDPTHELEAAILRERGRVTLQEADLDRARIDSAVARLIRVATRHREARDWFTGVRLYDPVRRSGEDQERHRVFNRQILEGVGFGDLARINAVANRVLLAQPSPKEGWATSPAEYLPRVAETQPGALQAQSIPMDPELWRPERFLDFMAARRHLLAEALNEFVAGWLPEDPDPNGEQYVRDLIAAGESDRLEFKSSLRWDRREERVNKELEAMVIKTVAGLLNSEGGGTLLIGVADNGGLSGLAADYGSLSRQDRDGFELHLQQLLIRELGEAAATAFLTVNFHQLDGADICQVAVDPSDHPIYVVRKGQAELYVRVGNGTKALPVDEAVRFVQRRFGGAR